MIKINQTLFHLNTKINRYYLFSSLYYFYYVCSMFLHTYQTKEVVAAQRSDKRNFRHMILLYSKIRYNNTNIDKSFNLRICFFFERNTSYKAHWTWIFKILFRNYLHNTILNKTIFCFRFWTEWWMYWFNNVVCIFFLCLSSRFNTAKVFGVSSLASFLMGKWI